MNLHWSSVRVAFFRDFLRLMFCYMPLLRDELHRTARLWNLHRIRPSTNLELPFGRPDVLFFFLPEVSGTKSYRVDVDLDELDLADSGWGKMLLSTSAKWLLEWIYTVGRNHETLFEEIDKIWMTEGMHNTVDQLELQAFLSLWFCFDSIGRVLFTSYENQWGYLAVRYFSGVINPTPAQRTSSNEHSYCFRVTCWLSISDTFIYFMFGVIMRVLVEFF